MTKSDLMFVILGVALVLVFIPLLLPAAIAAGILGLYYVGD